MLRIKGETRMEYFQVLCEDCGGWVRLTNARWVGGVPEVEAKCSKCGTSGNFKLHPPSWMDLIPLGEDLPA